MLGLGAIYIRDLTVSVSSSETNNDNSFCNVLFLSIPGKTHWLGSSLVSGIISMTDWLHDQYHGCWWPGDARSQGVSSHGIDFKSALRKAAAGLTQKQLWMISTNHTDWIRTNFEYKLNKNIWYINAFMVAMVILLHNICYLSSHWFETVGSEIISNYVVFHSGPIFPWSI